MPRRRPPTSKAMPMFGRVAHLEYLLSRAESPGLTAVTGRPSQGKTYLLLAAVEALRERGFLVGYFEANEGASDMLLYCVSSAYQQWLSRSSLKQQAKSLYNRHRDRLAPGSCKAVGDLLLAVAEDAKLPGAGAARKAFEGLLRAERDLQTGGLALPDLSTGQARELLDVLHELTDSRIVLVFDAWEQSGNVPDQRAFFEQFLRDWRNWPPLHVLVGCRERDRRDSAPFEPPADLARMSPRTEVWPLPAMDLPAEQEQQRNLLAFLRENLPAVAELDEERVLALIGGYPGVLRFWMDGCPRTAADLEALAGDAQALRYDDLQRRLLPELLRDGASTPQFALAARLALIPEMTSAEMWDSLRPVAFEGLDEPEAVLRQLASRGILRTPVRAGGPAPVPWEAPADLPRFPHTAAYAVAQRWFI